MRKLMTLIVLAAGALVVPHAEAAPPAAPQVTLSDHRPWPGERVTVWFRSPAPNERVKLYIDTPSHPLPSVTTSSTGYGSTRFTVAGSADPGTLHYLRLASTAEVVSVPFIVTTRGVRYDRWSDVRTTPGTGEEVFEPDPARKIGDITTTRIRYTRSTLRIVTYYRAIPQAGRKYLYLFTVKTPDVERHVTITTYHGNWAGSLVFAEPGGAARATTSVPTDQAATCSGISHRIEYAHRRSILSVPLACLRSPEVVRVGTAFFSLQSNVVESYDDGFDSRSDPLGPSLTLSSPFHR